MLHTKLLTACVATVLAIGLPLSTAPPSFTTGANTIEVNGLFLNSVPLNGVMLNGLPLNGLPLNGLPLNGTKATDTTLISSTSQTLQVEGGQLVIHAEIAH